MLAEYDGSSWGRTRLTIHSLLCHFIQLFGFGFLPFRPGVESAQFPSGEAAKGSFRFCAHYRGGGEGGDEQVEVVVGDIIEITIVMSLLRFMDESTDVAELVETKDKRFIAIFHGRVALGRENNGKLGGVRIVADASECIVGIVLGENRDSIDFCNESVAEFSDDIFDGSGC